MPDEITVEKTGKLGCFKRNENCDNALSKVVESKLQQADRESEGTSTSNYVSAQSTSQSHHVNLQNRNSVICKFNHTYVGMALENLPS